MGDGAAVADVDPTNLLKSMYTIVFGLKDSDAARIDAPPVLAGQEAQCGSQLDNDDVSVGSTFGLFAKADDEPEYADLGDVSEHLTRPAQDVLREIEVGLLEDREEALRYGDAFATESAVAGCKRVASQIVPWLVATPLGMKWAAFGEATGSVSLVLSSDVVDRRVDFRISPDGQHISAIRIDEHLRAKTVPLSLDDTTSLRENAAWVCGGV